MDIQGDCLDMEVGFDNCQVVFDMVSIMLDKCQWWKIFYLGLKDDICDEQCYYGYCDVMMCWGLVLLCINFCVIFFIYLGIQLMCDVFVVYLDVDGVFCINDDIVMGVLLWCCEC